MKSEWIMDMGEIWICRNCGEPCKDHFMGKPRWNFCPWCGADMRAEQTEPKYKKWETKPTTIPTETTTCVGVAMALLDDEPSTDCGWK